MANEDGLLPVFFMLRYFQFQTFQFQTKVHFTPSFFYFCLAQFYGNSSAHH